MYTIGRLAAMARVSTDALRYYERQHLLTPESKSPSGYRLYGETALRRLSFIKRSQECGFSIADIRQLLFLKTHHATCRDVKTLALDKKRDVDARIASLTRISQALEALIARCTQESEPVETCQLLAALETDTQTDLCCRS